jgi:cytochrome c oxidase subunit 3
MATEHVAADHFPASWHHFDDLAHQQRTTVFGMWTFLVTEVLIFGGLFAGYTAFRIEYAPAFEAASRHLNLWIGGGNTLVLLTSSLTMALAVHSAQIGNTRAVVRNLLLTVALGTVFLGLKALEYCLDYRENLVPIYAFNPSEWSEMNLWPEHVELFLIFYYCLTGLHAFHMVLGISIILILAWLAHRGTFSEHYYAPIESWGLYWHFVDMVWVFLLPLLYLVGTRAPH